MTAQPQEIDPQKAALLAAIAQQGSQGQVAFQAEASRRQQAQQAAVNAIADQSKMSGSAGNAPKAFTQGLQAQSNALGSVYDQDAMMSQRSFDNSIAQTSASNAAYMDQAKAAIPIVNAQTAGTVAQIRAEQEAAAAERRFQEEQRAFDAEQARIDAIEAAKDRAFAEEQRQWEREDRNLGSEDERAAQAQTDTVFKASSKDPVVGEVVAQIADSGVGNFRSAVQGVDSVLNSVLTAQVENDPNFKWDRKKKAEIVKSLYDFFDQGDGKSAPKDIQALGDYLRTQKIDPGKHLPGYITEREAAKVKAVEREAKKAQDATYLKAITGLRSYTDKRKKGKTSGRRIPKSSGGERDRNGRLPGHPAYEAGT